MTERREVEGMCVAENQTAKDGKDEKKQCGKWKKIKTRNGEKQDGDKTNEKRRNKTQGR